MKTVYPPTNTVCGGYNNKNEKKYTQIIVSQCSKRLGVMTPYFHGTSDLNEGAV